MRRGANDATQRTVEAVYRRESSRVLATLIRLVGDFDLAEEALHEAFTAAMDQWPRQGVPANPRAWLISAGRFTAVDVLRRRSRADASLDELSRRIEADTVAQAASDPSAIGDDRLRLIFTCCHPALQPEARQALTLRAVCGLTTEEIARAFLASPPAIAKRIVRAKAKIRDARIPYEIPSREELPDRLDSVLQVIYVLFTEGYAASSGAALTRPDLSGEAIRLARVLVELLPEAEVLGLLALMLLHESRRAARTSPSGDPVLLDDQDRSLWNREQIDEGTSLLGRALATGTVGLYTVQAAIVAVHADAATAAETDWSRIAELYDLLLEANPSPVVALNRAVAIAMRDGPEAGLALIDAILARGDLHDYHLAHSARGDLLRRLGRTSEAVAAYRRALDLATQAPAKRFLLQRIRELTRRRKTG
jgi:RNA polymerase sigma-70 factor (ECF subfamily)